MLKHIVIFSVISAFSCAETMPKNVDTKQPSLSSSQEAIQLFETKFGVHKAKRRNHISGFCFDAELTMKDEAIRNYTTSGIFSKKPLKVVGRFSHSGGLVKDESKVGQYGMGLQVHLENGSTHNMSVNTLDFFPVATPEGFIQLMKVKAYGKAEDVALLKANHPEFVNFKKHQKGKEKVLKSFANHTFNSINSFYLESQTGSNTPIRWSFTPNNKKVTIEDAMKHDLFAELQERMKTEKLTWDMAIMLANKDDSIDNASIAWQGEHKVIHAATLNIVNISKNGACDGINYDPLQVTNGIKPSDDPILKFRSPVYAESFGRRLSEAAK